MSGVRRYHQYKLVAADFVAAFLAWFVFFHTKRFDSNVFNLVFSSDLIFRSTIVASLWLILYVLLGRYKDIFRHSRFQELLYLAGLSLSGGLVLFLSLALEHGGEHSYEVYLGTIFSYILLHFAFTAFLKMSVLTHLKKLVKTKKVYFPTLLLGSSTTARDIYEELVTNNAPLGLRIEGFLQNDSSQPHAFQQYLPCLGSFKDLPTVLKDKKIEEVIIAIEPSEHKQIEETLNHLEGEKVRVSILPDLYQILLGSVRVTHLLGTPLIEIKKDLLPVWQTLLKRLFDIGISFFVLLLLAPVYLCIAILVKISSPGSIIFKQERVGLHGKVFQIYKFRSMYLNSEANGPALSSDKDPRVTPIGRYLRKMRLDELPQFYNVIIGDMSLVGPRPERKHFIDLITKEAPHYRHLQRVRPGITSLGQVKFGYAESVSEMVRRLKYDILYIENMSLGMDIRVILYTVKIIIQGRGK